MKRSLILMTVVLLTTVSCKVTVEEQLDKIEQHFNTQELTSNSAIKQYDGKKVSDYITLTLANETKMKDIWQVNEEGHNAIVAFTKGKKDREHTTMVAACTADKASCAAALEMLKAYKTVELRPRSSIKAVFYDDQASFDYILDECRKDKENITMVLSIHPADSIASGKFILNEFEGMYRRLVEVIPPYLERYGNFEFTNNGWEYQEFAPMYNYYLDEGNAKKETGMLTTFLYLLN